MVCIARNLVDWQKSCRNQNKSPMASGYLASSCAICKNKHERERESQKCAINAPNALTHPQESSGEQNLAPPQPHNRLSAQNSQEEVAGANIQFGISRSCRVTKRSRLRQHIRVHENDMHIISYNILDYYRIHVDIYSHTHRLIQAHFGIPWNVYTCI